MKIIREKLNGRWWLIAAIPFVMAWGGSHIQILSTYVSREDIAPLEEKLAEIREDQVEQKTILEFLREGQSELKEMLRKPSPAPRPTGTPPAR